MPDKAKLDFNSPREELVIVWIWRELIHVLCFAMVEVRRN